MNRTTVLRVLAGLAVLAAAVPIALYAVGIGIYVADQALSRWRDRAEWARTHTTLAQPITLDGAVLPAGTEVEWEDHSHSRITAARLPEPAEILGVPTRYLRRDGDGGWIVAVLGTREIDGWPCAGGEVQLTAAGRLGDCVLSRATTWQGWTLPERTAVHPVPSVHGVNFGLPWKTPLEMPLESPVLGPLPWLLGLNDDGSPSGAGYDQEAPHLVAGQRLWGDVRWEYDPATYGMGRERRPIRVSGFILVPDIAGRVARRHVVLPWDGRPDGARADRGRSE